MHGFILNNQQYFVLLYIMYIYYTTKKIYLHIITYFLRKFSHWNINIKPLKCKKYITELIYILLLLFIFFYLLLLHSLHYPLFFIFREGREKGSELLSIKLFTIFNNRKMENSNMAFWQVYG